jgi:Fur family ferric uptake transcriptional regulator
MQRNTWQRETVRSALDTAGGFISAQALHSELKESGSTIGLATVYRTLADLEAGGSADSLQRDGESWFRACHTSTHHHHLICRRCGRTVEIAADHVESWAQGVAAEHGFTDASHEVNVFGLCAPCTAELQKS